ncbi:hypothetical protein BAY61_12580 [Prauserella marina]|uniref:Uncharacterized protein n=1 Tax=Prauserella marina TaxID=530584 RepID=A0A222VP67_9PSEU|nr:hypothetical protein [Prauserella marina]ASR35700.1 hypothetical protein BAY61_12580 [Prauserella marina]PWV84423.1 hypothetical protein DES30_101440 [Prauserella marina]SDC22935.1 hypothetical protein SAMN05421630_101897 [Prauserella marina]
MSLGSRLGVAVSTCALVLSLAACGSEEEGSPVRGFEPNAEAGQPPAQAGNDDDDDDRAATLRIPEAFDAETGWIAEDDEGRPLKRFHPAPEAGALVFADVDKYDKITGLVARDARTGEQRWTSEVFEFPGKEEVEGARGRVLVTKGGDGKEYAVLAATGKEGGDGVNKSTDLTQLAVFDTATSGEGVAPVRLIDIPERAIEYRTQGDGRVLVNIQGSTAVVDVATGDFTVYEHKGSELDPPKPCIEETRNCDQRRSVMGDTGKGPLVQGRDVFWVAGGWISTDVIPEGATYRGSVTGSQTFGSPDGAVAIASWPTVEEENITQRVLAAHDMATGKPLAATKCETSGAAMMSTPPGPMTRSVDGRYLFGATLVLDLETGKGHCFTATDERERLEVSSVDSQGGSAATAYGEGGGNAGVTIDLNTGKATALPEGTEVPSYIGADYAVVEAAKWTFVYPRA